MFVWRNVQNPTCFHFYISFLILLLQTVDQIHSRFHCGVVVRVSVCTQRGKQNEKSRIQSCRATSAAEGFHENLGELGPSFSWLWEPHPVPYQWINILRSSLPCELCHHDHQFSPVVPICHSRQCAQAFRDLVFLFIKCFVTFFGNLIRNEAGK